MEKEPMDQPDKDWVTSTAAKANGFEVMFGQCNKCVVSNLVAGYIGAHAMGCDWLDPVRADLGCLEQILLSETSVNFSINHCGLYLNL